MPQMKPRALGSLVNRIGPINKYQLHVRAFDFYDHWSELDQEVSGKHPRLSALSEALSMDFNHLAVLASEMLKWARPSAMLSGKSVVIVGTLTEAYIVTLRSAADIVGSMAAYSSALKPAQAPNSSLHDLLKWANSHPSRVRSEARTFLLSDWAWFYEMRTMRDLLVHEGLHANIHCDRNNFRLWVCSPKHGWITRTPLFPLLGRWTNCLLTAANQCGKIAGDYISLPEERIGSRVLDGVYVPSLDRFLTASKKPVASDPFDTEIKVKYSRAAATRTQK